jgi:hypothetical protein
LEEGGDTMNNWISWSDFKKLISSPEVLAAMLGLLVVFLLYVCLPIAVIALIVKVIIYGL